MVERYSTRLKRVCTAKRRALEARDFSRVRVHFLLKCVKFMRAVKLTQSNLKAIAKFFDSDATGILTFTVQSAF